MILGGRGQVFRSPQGDLWVIVGRASSTYRVVRAADGARVRRTSTKLHWLEMSKANIAKLDTVPTGTNETVGGGGASSLEIDIQYANERLATVLTEFELAVELARSRR